MPCPAARVLVALCVFLVLVPRSDAGPPAPAKAEDEPLCKGRSAAEWKTLLGDKDPSVRRDAVWRLSCAGSDSEEKAVLTLLVPTLGQALADEDAEVRSAAAEAIGRVGRGAKAAVPLLIKAMKDTSPRVRGAAAGALGQIGPAAGDAVSVLTEALRDGDVSSAWMIGSRSIKVTVRMEAAAALGEIGPAARAAIPAIREMLKEKEGDAWTHACLGLCAFGPVAKAALPDLIELLKERREGIYDHLDLTGFGSDAKAAVPLLVEQLKSDDATVRAGAAFLSGQLGPEGKPVVPALATALRDEDDEVRWNALMSLKGLGPTAKPAVPALLEVLKTKDRVKLFDGHAKFYLPVEVARTLEQIGLEDREVIRALASAAKDREFLLHARPRDRLGPINETTVTTLMDLMKDKDPNVRAWSASTLGLLGTKGDPTVPALVERLKDEGGQVGAAAATALGQIGTQTKLTVPALARALGSDSAQVREAAADALGKLGSRATPAAAALTAALKDHQDVWVRVKAAKALYAATGQTEAVVPALAGAVRTKTRDYYARVVAAESLGEIGPAAKSAAAALTEALKDEDWMLRVNAALALYRILGTEAKAAVPALIERVRSGGSWSNEALKALRKLDPAAAAKAPLG